MPTYEYECAKCGHQFEVFQSMKDQALDVCPQDKCTQKRWGKGRIQRRLGTGAGLIFKGSGFYITDYRSEGYKAAARKEKDGASSPAPSATGSSSGSDAKPASAPASSAPAKPAPKPKPSAT